MERSSFFNAVLNGEIYDRVYLAEDYARYFSSFIGNGVFPTPSTNLQVVQNVNMQVKLKAGKGWINGYFYENTDDLTLNIDVADGVLKRIDRVILRLDFINREIKAYVKKGAFATSPVAPALTRNADVYELGLADVLINNGVTNITQANITDLRGNSNLCGLVAGVVQQIDTTNLFAQFQSTFDLWFEHVKGQLSTDAAGNLQNQIDTWNDFKTNFLSTGDNPTLGKTEHPFQDLILKDIGSVRNRILFKIVQINATTASSGQTGIPYPISSTRYRCYFIGGYVIKANNIANSVSANDFYYETSQMTFTAVEASRPYSLLFLVLD